MSVITMKSGRLVNPLELMPDDIDIEDIAHALSQMCRYGGSCPEFYSVAQHSVLVAKLCWERTHDAQIALQGLMHDAHEAYVGDLVRPMREQPEFAFFRQLEAHAQNQVLWTFRLPTVLASDVKQADVDMLVAEVNHFWGEELRKEWPDFPHENQHRQPILSQLPDEAKRGFLAMFYHLSA